MTYRIRCGLVGPFNMSMAAAREHARRECGGHGEIVRYNLYLPREPEVERLFLDFRSALARKIAYTSLALRARLARLRGKI